jgi:hypothetical protein
LPGKHGTNLTIQKTYFEDTRQTDVSEEELPFLNAVQQPDKRQKEKSLFYMDTTEYEEREPEVLKFIDVVKSLDNFDDKMYGNPSQNMSPKTDW